MSLSQFVLDIWESNLRSKNISFEEAYRQIANLRLEEEDSQQLYSFIKKVESKIAEEERQKELNGNFKQTQLNEEKST